MSKYGYPEYNGRSKESSGSGIVIAASLLFLLIVVVIPFCIWWFFGGAMNTKQYENNTQNQQYQAGLISSERDRVQAYDTSTGPQQKQIALTFCSVYPQITLIPSDLQSAHSRMCFNTN